MLIVREKYKPLISNLGLFKPRGLIWTTVIRGENKKVKRLINKKSNRLIPLLINPFFTTNYIPKFCNPFKITIFLIKTPIKIIQINKAKILKIIIILLIRTKIVVILIANSSKMVNKKITIIII